MARKGWSLKSYNYLYTFEKIDPAPYIYKLDYKATTDDDLDEYKEIFQDTGWEYVTQYGKWHYFRTLETGEYPTEIYTESEFHIESYKNLLRSLKTLLISLFVIAAIVLFLHRSALVIGLFSSLFFITILCIVKK